jgi:hypothetical protein
MYSLTATSLSEPMPMISPLVKAKELALESTTTTTTTQPTITLSSLDTPSDKLKVLFDQAVNQTEIQVNEKELSLRNKREMRKKEKFEAKQQRKVKALAPKQVLKVVLPDERKISGQDILKLRYSQDSIKSETQDGISLPKLIESMRTEGWRKGTALKIVSMPNGELVSLDNRRLYAAKEIAKDEKMKDFAIEINIYNHDDEAPKKLVSGMIEEYKKGHRLDSISRVQQLQLPVNIKAGTYGQCAILRTNTRHGDMSSEKYGYSTEPTIRNK